MIADRRIPIIGDPLTYFDDSKSPGTLWIGSNHGASIVKVEPLDSFL